MLGTVGMYFISIFSIPIIVLCSLESLRAQFFWGADIRERCMHWVGWEKALASRVKGGLGNGSLFAFNCAMLF